ncbi:mannitol-1-phosphate/altronate dehydrogenase [Propionibacteriaceae bacterium ES.041]|nr:nucleoside/nucleotide kinase family protein [Enemella evansiae]PFG69159.1 mannitol-1-phosphate/altronate dehydrogenase [Propionibacteriaceae bacterium ES.041]
MLQRATGAPGIRWIALPRRFAGVRVTVQELADRVRRWIRPGERRILGITGPPGTGKSHLAGALAAALGDRAVLVGMDAFHLANAELVRLGRRDRKGAPDTFDTDGYLALLRRLRNQRTGTIYAPVFDRSIETVIGSAIPIPAEVPLVITEGNYLVHDDEAWVEVRDVLDEVWYLDTPATGRARRLLGRRRSFGYATEQAASWVRDVDAVNAEVVEQSRERADLIVQLDNEPTPLTAANLPRFTAPVTTPDYPRDPEGIKVVHFGVGGFHRAHQAMYFDALLARGEHWGICGVGTLPQDTAIRDALNAQDQLYTLLTVAPDGRETVRIIGSHFAHLHAPDDPAAVIERLAHPDTRIVTLTITEGGYGVDDATPDSALGLITTGLATRRERGLPAYSVVSCDNILHNGRVAREAILGYAARTDPELADWIADNVAFPNSMVDRITPATSEEVRADVAALGIGDRWPVRSESFTQWVIEDSFSNGRPELAALAEAGVQVVEDVTPYEMMKLRLLNASHQVIGQLGLLAGATEVHEVMRDPKFAEFVDGYLREEGLPTLPEVPGIDLDRYCTQLLERYGSEAVRDTLERLVTDASDRISTFLLPVIADQLAGDGRIERSTLTIAAWCQRLASGVEINDRRRDEVIAAAQRDEQTPGAFLDLPLFGETGRNPKLREEFIRARERLRVDPHVG